MNVDDDDDEDDEAPPTACASPVPTATLDDDKDDDKDDDDDDVMFGMEWHMSTKGNASSTMHPRPPPPIHCITLNLSQERMSSELVDVIACRGVEIQGMDEEVNHGAGHDMTPIIECISHSRHVCIRGVAKMSMLGLGANQVTNLHSTILHVEVNQCRSEDVDITHLTCPLALSVQRGASTIMTQCDRHRVDVDSLSEKIGGQA